MHTFIMIFIAVYFIIAAFSYHFIMPKEDQENMSKTTVVKVLFLLLAPVAVIWQVLKNLLRKINNNC